MKQYRITKDDMLQDSSDDCYLAPTDPIHELKAVSYTHLRAHETG
jgi:hypothetical protein